MDDEHDKSEQADERRYADDPIVWRRASAAKLGQGIDQRRHRAGDQHDAEDVDTGALDPMPGGEEREPGDACEQ